MADETQYSSGPDTAYNKRKYEDQTPPITTRRPTGFSGSISSLSPDSTHAPPPSYNSVAPPIDDIQLAKQRAQEIASRLIINSAGAGLDSKRPKVENGSGFDSFDKDFSSTPSDIKSNFSNLGSAASAIPVSYGFQGSSKKIDIPNGRVGVIIGKGGETIKYLQLQSGAKIQVTRDMDADPNSSTRMVELMGTPEQISKAEQLISEVLSEAEAGGSGVVSRRLTGQPGAEQYVTKIPNNKVGLVIGKGGETIKSMQARTGARIQVIPLHLPPGDTSTERTLQIDGTSEQIEAAKQLVNEVISENRVRNPSMGGGYPQQGYQARPPTSWGPPGAPPVQQPGYGYGQPGAYSGPSSQYDMSQSYPCYPQQTSGGYPSNWDQSTAAPTQPPSQGSGYDYYNQQAPSQQQQTPGGATASGDNTGYNYGQPPASTYNQQGYPQDGYGGYNAPPQSGYGQQPSYDQQGYNSASGYGNVTNQTQEGHNSSYGTQGDAAQSVPPAQPQGYGTGQQPSPNPASYPGTTQPGYGMAPQSGYGNQPQFQPGYGAGYGAPPQAQKPPANNPPVYGQATHSPSTPGGGYGQPTSLQSGYPHSQPPPLGYAQPDSGTQRTAPSGYGAAAGAQAGYGGPASYGAPPAGQQGYGQAAPPYAASYGSGYSQPPVYSADGGSGGNGAPAAASQTVQQGGTAKASPRS